MNNNNLTIDKDFILEELFQSNYIAILVVDKDRNNILVNNKLCEMFGYTKEEILATDVKIFHLDFEHYKEFGEIAFNHVLKKIPMSVNYQFKKKNGQKFWAKISGDPIKHKDYVLWTLIDITKNIEIEEELEEQKNLLRILIDEIPNPIVLKNYSGKFVLANKATAKLYGCQDPDSMIGKDDGDYIPDKELAEFFKKNVREIIDKEETQIVYEDSIDVETNETRNYMSIKKPFVNNLDEKMILVLANDITEMNRKNSELAKQERVLFHQSKLAAMGEMIANIAHQWRQPLSAISTLATGMQLQKEMGSLDDKTLNKSLEDINKTTQYLSQTIEDFRSFFNPKENDAKEFYISKLFNKIENLIIAQYKSKEIAIIKELNDFEVKSHENELLQVLINILNNSKDALLNCDYERFIFIKTYKKESKSYIEILDNAKGIEETIMEQIFEPYFTTKHKSQGTGIGLYMANEIVTKHLNGKIEVENKEFEYKDKKYSGACFKIII